MNAKQRRTWYRALRPTMQAIVLHAKISDTVDLNGARYAAAVLYGPHGWKLVLQNRLTPRWRLTRIALRRQKEVGTVWNAKR